MIYRLFFFLLCWMVIMQSCGGQSKKDTVQSPEKPLSYDPPGSTDTRSKPVVYQQPKVYFFKKTGVGASNRFAGARLNDFKQINENTFAAVISAENTPINQSPWYAFKIWSKKPKQIRLQIQYVEAKHRYTPKLSRDGKNWQQIDKKDLRVDKNGTAFLSLSLSPDTLWVAAQEIITSQHHQKWIDSLSHVPFVRTAVIGKSTLGKDLTALHISESEGKNTVVVLSRQHPPEVTGYLAMQAFIRMIAGDTELAKEFRYHFEVIAVPMMNPDGVDNGHWRHNAGGVDLNRDWQFFRQPETAAVKGYIEKYVAGKQAQVYFGVDFHSTHEDIFYTYADSMRSVLPGFTAEWIDGIEAAIPELEATREPFGSASPISKNWFYHAFRAEAVTYEVGDNTPRELVKIKGEVAAQKMMELLLEKAGKKTTGE